LHRAERFFFYVYFCYRIKFTFAILLSLKTLHFYLYIFAGRRLPMSEYKLADGYRPTHLMLPTSHYDKRRADFAVSFISMLRHTTGEWAEKQFKLMPWQERIVRDLFGIVDRKTGYRQFRTAYVEIGKKNGKSELAAAIALYLLYADNEMGAEVYSCANDINQASIVYNTAKSMVEQCPDLLKLSKLVPSTKRIAFPHTNSFYRVLSSETKSKQGFNVSGLVFDELFAQQTRELFDTMTKFTGDARRQPLYFLITTAGRDKTSICYEIHCKALAVLDGSKIDPTFYPAVFGIGEKDNWEDEKVWRRVNPSIGVTIPFETVKSAYEQAKQNPAEETHFRQFRLNEWCNADVRWMPMDRWDACGQRDAASIPASSADEEVFDYSELEGRDCYGGLDLSSTTDLTSFVLVFPPSGGDTKYTVLPFFWLPADVIDLRTRRDHVPYEVWKKTGVFYTTEGNVVDYDYIVAFIAKLAEKYRIREIAYDRYGAEKIRRDLEELGAENAFLVFPFGQGFISMSPPSKDLFQFVMEGKIRHGKHPVLDWNMSNVIIDSDAAGNIKPNKRKSTEKIDGCIALVMAFARAALGGGVEAGSVYDREDRGLFII
jgi:phage terminase large subunit-like protein